MAAGVVVHDRIVIDIAVPVPGLGLIWIRHDRIRLGEVTCDRVHPPRLVEIQANRGHLAQLPGVAVGVGGGAAAVARFAECLVAQFERPGFRAAFDHHTGRTQVVGENVI